MDGNYDGCQLENNMTKCFCNSGYNNTVNGCEGMEVLAVYDSRNKVLAEQCGHSAAWSSG